MSKETTTLTKRSNEILRRIEEYFGESTHRVDAYQAGKVLELYIKYEDFEPKRKVQRTIEDMDESVNIIEIAREYSNDAIASILINILYDRDVFIQTDESTMSKVKLYDLVEGEALNRTFVDGDLLNERVGEFKELEEE